MVDGLQRIKWWVKLLNDELMLTYIQDSNWFPFWFFPEGSIYQMQPLRATWQNCLWQRFSFMLITEKPINCLTNIRGCYSTFKFLRNQKLSMLTSMTFTLYAHDQCWKKVLRYQHLILLKNKRDQIILEIMSLNETHPYA